MTVQESAAIARAPAGFAAPDVYRSATRATVNTAGRRPDTSTRHNASISTVGTIRPDAANASTGYNGDRRPCGIT